jgi:hypothetical protein
MTSAKGDNFDAIDGGSALILCKLLKGREASENPAYRLARQSSYRVSAEESLTLSHIRESLISSMAFLFGAHERRVISGKPSKLESKLRMRSISWCSMIAK